MNKVLFIYDPSVITLARDKSSSLFFIIKKENWQLCHKFLFGVIFINYSLKLFRNAKERNTALINVYFKVLFISNLRVSHSESCWKITLSFPLLIINWWQRQPKATAQNITINYVQLTSAFFQCDTELIAQLTWIFNWQTIYRYTVLYNVWIRELSHYYAGHCMRQIDLQSSSNSFHKFSVRLLISVRYFVRK